VVCWAAAAGGDGGRGGGGLDYFNINKINYFIERHTYSIHPFK
jgi:hypothetical protein